MILEEMKEIAFFDGKTVVQNCLTKNEYWLGSTDADDYLNARIFFFNKKEGELTIKLFKHSNNLVQRKLSDWDANGKGFSRTDLLNLSKCFRFDLQEDSSGNMEATFLGYSLCLIISIETNKLFFLIYSINGGRAPESIYFFGLYEVSVGEEFKNRYVSKVF